MSRIFLKYYLKSVLTSKYLWGWSITFAIFLLFVGALSWPSNLSPDEAMDYAAAWYSTMSIISLGSAAVGLSFVFVFASISARYLAKFSTLTPSKLYGSLFLGFITVCVIVVAILTLATYVLFSFVSGMNLVPANIPGLILATIATGAMLYAFAEVSVFTSIAFKSSRSIYFATYLPLILALGLGLLEANKPEVLGWGIIVSPFNAAQTLLYEYYAGKLMKVDDIVLEPTMLWISLIVWIIALAAIGIILLRTQKGILIEELRLY